MSIKDGSWNAGRLNVTIGTPGKTADTTLDLILTITGTLQNGKLAGDLIFQLGGEREKGTWEALRRSNTATASVNPSEKPQSTEAQGSQQQPSPSLGSGELPKPVSNGTHELQVTKTTRGRKFQNMETRNENDVFLTVYLATKDPCFDWQNDKQCFSPRVKGFNKVSKACGSVADDSGKKYVADGGGNTMDGNTARIMCNYIVPKTLGAVTLRLTGYPEIKLPAE